MEFLKNNLWEIRKSSALQFFGGLLGLVHLATYLFWHQDSSLPLLYHSSANPICWGMMESCHWTKLLSPTLMQIIFHSYAAFAVLTLLLFFFTRAVGLAWFTLFFAFVLKIILYVQDARLGNNIQYLFSLLNIGFLIIPSKLLLLRLMFISYFMMSGYQKLSPDWLTGQWFVETLKVHVKLGEWLAGISVLVEMLAPVALLFRDLKNFLLGYFALVVYAGLMFYSGLIFESLVLFALLQLFSLIYFEEKKIEREYLYQSFIRPEPSRAWAAIVLVSFWLIQILPLIHYPPLEKLTAISQKLALSPASSGGECRTTSFLVYSDRLEVVDVEPRENRPESYRCNPYLKYVDIKNLCTHMKHTPGFRTIMSYMSVRELRDQSFRVAFEVDDFCQDSLTYRQIAGARHGI